MTAPPQVHNPTDLPHNNGAVPTKPRGQNLIGLTRDDLKAVLADMGVPDRAQHMRAQQLWHWIYHRGVRDFHHMTTIAKDMRQALAELYCLERPEIVRTEISQDGTRKWLIQSEPGVAFETVYIPEENRGTLCISSQVGCTLNCTFCLTGTQRLVRNLSAGEIVAQLMIARDELDDWPVIGASNERDRAITNIVMMGMGEPLYNFDNTKKALSIVSDGDGIAISKRRITLSTAGVVPEIPRCGHEIGVMLAISLHAVRDEVRDELVPLNKKYPLADLLAACRAYPTANNSKRITFEYVMLKQVNDSLSDAKELVRLLKGIPAKVNLIPFNPWPGAPYQCAEWQQIEAFAQVLMKAGYASPIRTPRGRDIMAACGQLKSDSVRPRASARHIG